MVSDRYPKPAGWDDVKYGEYSEEKYAFWVTVMQTVYENAFFLEADWSYNLNITKVLLKELDKYNAAHPGNHKPFDFPRSED